MVAGHNDHTRKQRVVGVEDAGQFGDTAIARVSLDQVTKVYPNGFEAVHTLDLAVEEGEFMVLVGPSGCGKTTVLRMVAGLEEITSGKLLIGDEVMNNVAPRDRDIAMVFQSYALYPHMTVAENIGHSLKVHKVPKAEISRRVRDIAKVLGLTEWLNRKPDQLSGGQRQRVAMGRAIVRNPSVFLMDEPLSNLDAKLRVQMRTEVLAIQRRIGVATMYVTHDQTEAMTMGDRVAVLRDGSLQQCAVPQDLYDNPANVFVAAFIGSPAMNLFESVLSADGTLLSIGSQQLRLPSSVTGRRPRLESFVGKPVIVGIRPENFSCAASRDGELSLEATVTLVEALGSELMVHIYVDATAVRPEGVHDGEGAELTLGDSRSGAEAVARLGPKTLVKGGDQIRLTVDTDELHFFDPSTGDAIRG